MRKLPGSWVVMGPIFPMIRHERDPPAGAMAGGSKSDEKELAEISHQESDRDVRPHSVHLVSPRAFRLPPACPMACPLACRYFPDRLPPACPLACPPACRLPPACPSGRSRSHLR